MSALPPKWPLFLGDKTICNACTQLVQDVISSDPLPTERWKKSSTSKPLKPFSTPHHSLVDLLEECGNRQCKLCHFLLSRVRNPSYLTSQSQYEIWTHSISGAFCVQLLNDDYVNPSQLHFFDRYSLRELSDFNKDLRLICLKWSREWFLPALGTQSPPPRVAKESFSEPLSSKCTALAARWLRDCLDRHPDCARPATSPLPKRVVNVGHEDSEPYLYVTAGECEPYMTLSYCWGGDVEAKTVTTNIASYQKAIPMSRLPQTFKDAIMVARKLSCSYLWIDALCIVQDDPGDWQTEAAGMSQVYTNSILTISALRSSRSEGGFLKTRVISEVDLGICQLSEDTEKSTIGIGVHDSFVVPIFGPLCTRAWALQERFLSPAVLHYSSSGMVWECRSLCMRESGLVNQSNSILKALWSRSNIHLDDCRTGSGHDSLWMELVEEYSSRDLTFPEDKLPAFAGIARAFRVMNGSQYVVGLWKHDLARGLLWQGGLGSSSLVQVIPSRAPSWSWAALDGPMYWHWSLRRYEQVPSPNIIFQIRDIHIQERLPGSCGTVSGGYLTVRGFLYEGNYTQRPDGQDTGDGTLHMEFGISVDCRMDTDFSSRTCWVLPVGEWASALLEDHFVWGLVLGKGDGTTSFQGLRNEFIRIAVACLSLTDMPNLREDKLKLVSLL